MFVLRISTKIIKTKYHHYHRQHHQPHHKLRNLTTEIMFHLMPKRKRWKKNATLCCLQQKKVKSWSHFSIRFSSLSSFLSFILPKTKQKTKKKIYDHFIKKKKLQQFWLLVYIIVIVRFIFIVLLSLQWVLYGLCFGTDKYV